MIGGRVIEVRYEIGRTRRLWVMDAGNEAAIYVKPEDEMPACGDWVWRQQGHAMWTPQDRRFTDRKLRRVGYSFNPRMEAT
jgi:hypothetical protein